jgi:hypothetical protein
MVRGARVVAGGAETSHADGNDGRRGEFIEKRGDDAMNSSTSCATRRADDEIDAFHRPLRACVTTARRAQSQETVARARGRSYIRD